MMLVRTYSYERENRWHIADENGNPICGRPLTPGRRKQTRESHDNRPHMVCGSCRKKQAAPQPTMRFTKSEALALHQRAEAAAREAAEGAAPTPMLVGDPVNLLGSLMGTDNRIDYTKPVHVVNDGVCGMAWVTIQPGSCSLARRLLALSKETNGARRTLGDPHLSVHRGYYGGMEVYRPGYNGQSYERGMAAARAYAAVLQEAGVEAIPGGRLD